MDQFSPSPHWAVKGMTLIETMIALMLMSVFSVAIVTMIVQVLSNSASAQLQNQAIALAEKNLEQVRTFYQSNGYVILAKVNDACPSGCFLDGNLTCASVGTSCIDGTASSCSSGRVIRTDPYVSQSIKVSVDDISNRVAVDSWIAWTEKGTCRTNKVSTNFYNY